MFHSLCSSGTSPLQSFLYRHFYRYFDTIHPRKLSCRIQAILPHKFFACQAVR